MPSTAQIRARAARRTRWAIYALIAVVVFLCGVIAVLLTDGGTPNRQAASSAPSPGSSAPATVPPPDNWVQLPDPGHYVDKTYPVNFPHKPEGAVATLVAQVQFGWSMDPLRNSRVTGLYAAPQNAADAQHKATELAAFWRRKVGVPVTGPVPADAAMRVVPVAVQWQVLDGDRVWAAVEAQIQTTPDSATQPTDSMTAVSAEMRWLPSVRGGDWAYLPTSRMPPQTAQPTDPAFSQLGWRALGTEH